MTRWLATPGTDRSWVWVVTGLLTAGAVVLSWWLGDGCYRQAPAVAVAPVRAAASAIDAWAPIPSVPANGWLPESRWSAAPAFDVRECTVKVAAILDMPPGVDDVPSLDQPRFVPASAARWLGAAEEVIGVVVGGVARCYPLPIVRWHNVVNDRVAGQPLAVVFDPISGASLAVSRKVTGQTLTFGVSGKAYNGCVLLYDREGRSLWYPLRGDCLTGPRAGRVRLQYLPAERTTWEAWHARYRGSEVLSRNTGYGRAYEMDPYAHAPIGPGGRVVNYWAEPALTLAPPVKSSPNRGLAPKTIVLGVRVGSRAIAFAPAPVRSGGSVVFTGEAAGKPLQVVCDWRPATRRFTATLVGAPPPHQVACFWYAWQAAYPDTELVHLAAATDRPEAPYVSTQP